MPSFPVAVVPRVLTKPEPTKVATKNIEYVGTLWDKYVAVRDDLAKKEEYLREAQAVGVKTATLAHVAERVRVEGEQLHRSKESFERIKQLLTLGAEPTTPPDQWYAGRIETPKARNSMLVRQEYPVERWPSYNKGTRAFVYTGPIPVAALQKYAAMRHLIDDVRIYSPDRDHFKQMPEPIVRHIDPVMIGVIEFLDVSRFFTLARWDVAEDLAAVFGKSGARHIEKPMLPEKPAPKRLGSSAYNINNINQRYSTGTEVVLDGDLYRANVVGGWDYIGKAKKPELDF